jgi:hypothetical protein
MGGLPKAQFMILTVARSTTSLGEGHGEEHQDAKATDFVSIDERRVAVGG